MEDEPEGGAEFTTRPGTPGPAGASGTQLFGVGLDQRPLPAADRQFFGNAAQQRLPLLLAILRRALFEAGDRVAVLLGQNLIGRKKWERQ